MQTRIADVPARAVAIDLLARREHSRAELARKLQARGIAAAEIEAALADLAAEGLQSDDRFAEILVESRAARGYGPVRIAHELREHGVAADPARAAMERDPEFWNDRAAEARRKRFGPALPDGTPARAKQARFLEYRGFTAAQVRAALRQRDPG
ncbi:MAG: regulatory protein RecX [Gammaproteobacteria bacterium]